MAIFNYQDLMPAELESINRARALVFINLDPMENHGPHLPFGSDLHQSVWFTKKTAGHLQASHSDWNFIIMPPIPAGSDTMINKGSIEISPRTLRAILFETCVGLAKQGFKKIIVMSAHGGPRHLVVCEEVSEKLRWRHKTTFLSVPSRILLTIFSGKFMGRIEEKLKNAGYALNKQELDAFLHDYHGGLMETSMMLTVRPDLVKPVFRELRPAIINKIWKLTRKSGLKAGDGLGYVGSPAFSRSEIGKTIADVILEDLIPLIQRAMNGDLSAKDVRKEFRAKLLFKPHAVRFLFKPHAVRFLFKPHAVWLYYIPHFRTDFKMAVFIALYAAIFGAAWIYIVSITSEVLK